MIDEILQDARDRIIAELATVDEFDHRLAEHGDRSLRRNESVRAHVERVLNEIEGLRRRLLELAPNDDADDV
jgi:hypothetical protein